MVKTIIRLSAFIFFASLVAIFQASLISAWPSFFGQINLVLIVLIFTLFFFGSEIALWLVLIFGLWLGLIYFQFFAFFLIILLVTALLAQVLLKNWLTNRSLYSFLALILTATVVYNFLTAILFYLFLAPAGYFFLVNADFWLALLYQGGWSLAFALLLYHLSTALTKRLQPFFLETKSHL
jgi:hypothetical protein